jgi:hypothetical protein
MRRGVLRRRLKRETGQALVLVALALPIFFAVALVFVDGSRLFVGKRQMQNAADAVALAAAKELPDTDIPCTGTCETSLRLVAERYSSDNGGPSVLTSCAGDASATNCYQTPYKTDNRKVQVRLQTDVSTFFGGVVSAFFGGSPSVLHPAAKAAAGAVVMSGGPDDSQLGYWNRIYSDKTGTATSCDFIIFVDMVNPVSGRGNLCLGTDDGPGRLLQIPIVIGGNVNVAGSSCGGKAICQDSRIGAAGSPLDTSQVSIGGGPVSGTGKCQYWGAALHARPCTSTDHIYTTLTQTLEPPDPSTLSLPSIGPMATHAQNWTYWRANADLGPSHACDYSAGTVPSFSTTTAINLTPTGASTANPSYVCRRCNTGVSPCNASTPSAGVKAELSWKRNNCSAIGSPCSIACTAAGQPQCDGVLTIKGTIFFNAGWTVSDRSPTINENQNIDYNGLGSLFFSNKLNFAAGKSPNICAGGDGTYACQASTSAFQNGPPVWDPNVNMMTVYAINTSAGRDIDWHGNSGGTPDTGGAFMGQAWSDGQCVDEGGFWSRASYNCGDLVLNPNQGCCPQYYFQFPPTSTLQPPQEGGSGGSSGPVKTVFLDE